MNDPIDLKTKRIIPIKAENKFKKSLVLENLELNILTHWDTWGNFNKLGLVVLIIPSKI